VPGHWEGDLIAVFADSYIATLVERQSRFTMLVEVKGKDTHTVVTALSKHVRKLPTQLRQYFPKGSDLSVHSQAELNKVARKLNQRPRKTWGYKNSADKLQESVAAIS
jgi:IS30 family transposase